jgi:hypothetical protein
MLLLLACTDSKDASDDTATMGDDSATASADDTGGEDTGDTTGGTTDAAVLAASVSEDALRSSIEALQDFGTRSVGTPGHDEAQAWIADQMESLGLAVELDAFSVGSEDCANVIGRLEGSDSARVWIFSAHFDSTSPLADTLAPGADDNASGVAAVLEAARILAQVHPRDTIWFVAMDAEELGSLGSAHLAEVLGDEAVDVQGVIAPDMIGYWPLGSDDAFDILGDDESEWMVEDMATTADALGVGNKTWIQHRYCYGDDHTSFQDAGFPAVSPMDCVEAHNVPSSGEETPHYHQTSDTVDTLDLGFTRRVVGVVVATLGSWSGA